MSLTTCTVGDLAMKKGLEDLAVLTTWDQTAKFSEEAAAVSGNWFGDKVAINGDSIIASVLNANKVKIYAKTSTSWVNAQNLTTTYAPSSIAFTSDFIIVGEADNDQVEIFHKASGSWPSTPQQTLTGISSSRFGFSVSISGSNLIVGAPYDNTEYSRRGSAFIYNYSGTSWSLQTSILALDRAANDYFGTSVSISGDFIVVGASGKDSNKGASYIYWYNGSYWGTITYHYENKKIFLATGANNDYFGKSVAIDGNAVIVGVKGDDSAYVYRNEGANNWLIEKKITAQNGKSGDNFGWSVALSGNYAIVGAYASNSLSGSAYIFESNSGEWTQFPQSALDHSAGDEYGCAVGIFGDTAIVGANQCSINSNAQAGAAYIITRHLN